MKRAIELQPGDKLWMYVWEPMEPCFPVRSKQFTITRPSTDLNTFYLRNDFDKESAKEERHVIKVLDVGINAHVKGNYYIWMTEPSLTRAYEIIRDYFMERLCKATDEIKTLTQVFANLEGWNDCYRSKEKFTEVYIDNNAEVTF